MSKPEFDLESVYDAQIFPLMTQIIEICKLAGLPFCATFLYRHGNNVSDYCTTYIPRDVDGETWEDERLLEMKSVAVRKSPSFFAFTISKVKEA